MGIREEYEEDVRKVEESLSFLVSKKTVIRLKGFLDYLLPFALILMSFVVLFQFFSLGPVFERYVNYFNWFVIVFFAARLGIGFRLANSNRKFVEDHWLDALMVIPALTIAEELELGGVLESQVVGEHATAGLAILQNLDISAKLTRITRLIKRTLQF